MRAVTLPGPDAGHPGSRPSVGRATARDIAGDLGAVLVAVLVVVLVFALTPGPAGLGLAAAPPRVALAAGIVSWLSLWWRRRAPVVLAGSLLAVSLVVPTVVGAALVALYTVGAHRRLQAAAVVTGGAIAATALGYLLHPPAAPWPADVTTAVAVGALFVAAGAWGAMVRARRELLASLAERARRAESEQELRLEQARRRERERIAREMHDVLAHRLSLLSVHAGALEFRPDAPPHTIAATAGVIRASAHQSLTDLRELLAVLREPGPPPSDDGPSALRPTPGLDDVDGLVADAGRAGNPTRLHLSVEDPSGVRDLDRRTIYRVVQEGLTNARKHAAHQPVDVHIEDAEDGGVLVVMSNPVGSTSAGGAAAVPGSAVGLAGLDERVALAGGTSSHGVTSDGRFRLRVHLPGPR